MLLLVCEFSLNCLHVSFPYIVCSVHPMHQIFESTFKLYVRFCCTFWPNSIKNLSSINKYIIADQLNNL